MKIIIAPTWVMADRERRRLSLPRRETTIVHTAESARFAFEGRVVDVEDVIDLGRPEKGAGEIDALVAARVRRPS